MIFYKNHNLLIYSKIIIITLKPFRKIIINKIIEDFSKSSSKSFNFKNDLSDVKEIQRDFQ